MWPILALLVGVTLVLLKGRGENDMPPASTTPQEDPGEGDLPIDRSPVSDPVVEPGPSAPAPAERPAPKYPVGSLVDSLDGQLGPHKVDRVAKWDTTLEMHRYHLAGRPESELWAEISLRAARAGAPKVSPAPVPEPEPPSGPTSPAKWKLGSPVETVDGLGEVDAVKWGPIGQTWLYQMKGKPTWYVESAVSAAPPPLPSPETLLERRKVEALCQHMAGLGSNPQVLVPSQMPTSEAQEIQDLEARYAVIAGRMSNHQQALAVGRILGISDSEALDAFGSVGANTNVIEGVLAQLRYGASANSPNALQQAGLSPSRAEQVWRQLMDDANNVRRQMGDNRKNATKRYFSIKNKYERSDASMDRISQAVLSGDIAGLAGKDLLIAAGPPQGVSPGIQDKVTLQSQLGC